MFNIWEIVVTKEVMLCTLAICFCEEACGGRVVKHNGEMILIMRSGNTFLRCCKYLNP